MPLADVILALVLLVALAILVLQVVLLRRGRTDDGLAIRLDALRSDG